MKYEEIEQSDAVFFMKKKNTEQIQWQMKQMREQIKIKKKQMIEELNTLRAQHKISQEPSLSAAFRTVQKPKSKSNL